MSARRAARGGPSHPSAASGAADLLAGPCIEDWAPDDAPPQHAAKHALRAWGAALAAWARDSGVTYWDARAQARTATPWSRAYLIESGRAALADYYDGRGPRPS